LSTLPSHRWRARVFAAVLLILLTALPHIALAAQVSIPLNIDYITLGEALKRQMYTASGGRAELWNGSDQCQFFYAANPRFGRTAGSLKLETDAKLSVGVSIAGKCVSPLTWSGIVEAETQPYIGPELAIKFRVTNLNLYKPNHEKSLLVGRGFDLIKGNLIPRLEAFSFDLRPPLQQLDTLVQAAAAPDVAERVKTALSTLRPASAVVPEDESLRITLELTVPDVPTPIATTTAAPLTQAEIDAWQNTLDTWDAFMVFAMKQLGGAVADKEVRAQLLDLLLDSRHRLVEALGEPQAAGGADPVRIIFLDEWSRLRAIIRSTAQRGMLGDRALEFLSFISAGDALFALDQAAPALGVRISADDLRRLARMMAPEYAADPLAFSFDVDPQLQQMFGVSAPLESPGPLDVPEDTSSPAPTVSSAIGAATPEPRGKVKNSPPPVEGSPPQPTTTPVSPPSPASSPHATLWIPLRLLGPAEADAAENPLVAELLRMGAALKRVVVDDSNASRYTRSVQNLLTLTARREIDEGGLAPGFGQTYVTLVKSTGWQESCWRQFVRRRQRVRFLESSTGDIGLMQVNKHVWRGFYSLRRLEWDVVYNTSAGAEILMRLMRSAAERKDVVSGDQLAAIARSTYSAYNGGPGAHNRWRRPGGPAQTRQIDAAFWTKYQAMSSGQGFDILQCAMQWDTAPGH
jgi:transglycosylase-like protein with SLT domain